MAQLERFRFGETRPENDWGKDIQQALLDLSERLIEILNSGILVADNMDVGLKSVTTSATPDTESAVAHGLNRTPTGYIVYSKDNAAHIYDGSSSWDATNIYVRSDVASVTAKILIF